MYALKAKIDDKPIILYQDKLIYIEITKLRKEKLKKGSLFITNKWNEILLLYRCRVGRFVVERSISLQLI